jgi:hypothetical protein
VQLSYQIGLFKQPLFDESFPESANPNSHAENIVPRRGNVSTVHRMTSLVATTLAAYDIEINRHHRAATSTRRARVTDRPAAIAAIRR